MIKWKNIQSLTATAFILIISLCLSAQDRSDRGLLTGKQEKPLPHEKVLLLTDRDLYICGETIYFTGFTYDANSFLGLSFSSVLYAELYDTENKVIARGKFAMSAGQATGSLQIPRAIKSGIFFIRAYTYFMRNFGDSQYDIRRLRIINPLSQVAAKKTDSVPPSGNQLHRRPYSKIEILLKSDTSVYKPGETAAFKIIATDESGLPVITGLVISATLTTDGFAEESKFECLTAPDPGLDTSGIGFDKMYLPELRGDLITGKALYNGKPAAGIKVQQSFTGTSSCVESCITDSEGNFIFTTENEKNRGDLILKAESTGQGIILIPDNEFSEHFPAPSKEKLELSAEEAELIKKMFVNIQVEDAFRSTDSVRITKEKLMTPFYGDEYNEYDFSNYLRLPNMKEFAFEIILGVTTSKINKQDVIHITDKNFRDIGPDPLILIDGVPVSDHSAALSIDPEKIRVVRVVRDKYFYKDQVFDGILDIITKQGDARAVTLPEGTFRMGFLHPETTGPEDNGHPFNITGDKIPVYRNLVYYNSSLRTNQDGQAAVSFRTPDNKGVFRIRCFVKTPDGKAGEGTCKINVR